MENKELNSFTKSVITEGGLETPSPDFVKNVMRKVALEATNKAVIVYKPLISKTGWILSITIFVLIVTTVFFSDSTISVFSNLDLSFFDEISPYPKLHLCLKQVSSFLNQCHLH